MVGHNWGAQHAERWIWLHGAGRGAGAWLDAAIGRISWASMTTPWIANGALCLDGERFAVGGPGRGDRGARGARRVRVHLPGRGSCGVR